MQATGLMSADLLHLPDDGMNHELIDGRLTTAAPGVAAHGITVVVLGAAILDVIPDRSIGKALVNAGFILARDPDTVLGPDISFVSQERLDRGWSDTGFLTIAPDLAVEVLSPTDAVIDLNDRINRFFAAETRLIWIVDPYNHLVTVHRPDRTLHTLTGDEVLTGEEVLPTFGLALAELFSHV